jgi:SAM-dependent methyltransferase
MELPVLLSPLHLEPSAFLVLLRKLGPSLGLWRAAEVAALRQHEYRHPLLDMGCGDGIVTSMVLKRVEIGCEPYLKAALAARDSNLYERIEPFPVEAADLPDGSFATVVSNSVLEHTPSLGPVIETVSRALAPGGYLVLAVPTGQFARWLALPFSRYAAWRNRRLVHINLWTAEKWAGCLARFGLEVVSVRPYLRRSLVAAWDAIDLLEQIWVMKKRLVGLVWLGLPLEVHKRLAIAASRLDLSSPAPGGGHVIIARKEG